MTVIPLAKIRKSWEALSQKIVRKSEKIVPNENGG